MKNTGRRITCEEIGTLLLYFSGKGQRRNELLLWILYACALRPGECRMSLYYGKVIPASVRQEVNKLVDQMNGTIERQAAKAEQTEAKTRRIG